MSIRYKESYFDKLPKEALENILRLTTEKPRHRNWVAFADPDAVLFLLTLKAGVLHCVRDQFRVIEACGTVPDQRRGLLILGSRANTRHRFPKLVHILGDSLSEVRISTGPFLEFPWRWKRALVAHCVGLKKLSLRSERLCLDEVLSARGPALESLEFGVKVLDAGHIDAISKYTRALHAISIEAERVQPGADLMAMWSGIGAGLQEISFVITTSTSVEEQRHALFGMAEYCRAVRRLAFRHLPAQVHLELVGLCQGYGNQLVSLTLEECDAEPSVFESIGNMCPNVRLHVSEEMGCSSSALMFMGEKAASVNIGNRTIYHGNAYEAETLERVSSSCRDLESIEMLNNFAVEPEFQALFKYPMKKLREFKAGFLVKARSDVLLDVLAVRVTSLQHLELSCPISVSVLRKVVKANRNLRYVCLISISVDGLCMCTPVQSNGVRNTLKTENWSSLVDVFLQCPELEELEFSCGSNAKGCAFGPFVDTCQVARKRNVSVRICNYQYS